MATPRKSFDCVALMRQIRDQVSQEFQNMSYEEQKQALKKTLKHWKPKKKAQSA